MPAHTLKALDFEQEVQQLADNKEIGKDDNVIIWGGAFESARLDEFLKSWDLTRMNYRIWEYVHCIEFITGDLPNVADYHLLERGRLFGMGGDLSLRRDSDKFLWHFIGDKGPKEPAGFAVADFWAESPEIKADPSFKLRLHDEPALLWGDYKKEFGRWHDDRVGWAQLNYPMNSSEARQQGKRLEIHYTVLTHGGQVAFVWWKELKEHG